MISTVKLIPEGGYLVNGGVFVSDRYNMELYWQAKGWLDAGREDYYQLKDAHDKAQAEHDNWLAINSYEADVAEYETALTLYNGWEWSIESPDKPELPTPPVKPSGYYTQEQVDESQLRWDAWNVLYQGWVASDDELKGYTYHVPEPTILLRPENIPEPVVPELPEPVPNTPEPEFTAEELEQQAYTQWKTEREQAVSNITVTTQAGNVFDGDEISQTRMVRAITVLSSGVATELPWVLADNTVVVVGVSELVEALALSGAAQSALWIRS